MDKLHEPYPIHSNEQFTFRMTKFAKLAPRRTAAVPLRYDGDGETPED